MDAGHDSSLQRTRTIPITITLFLGEPPHLSNVVEVDTVEVAVDTILAGSSACLPHDAWDDARLVLQSLGADPQWAAFVLASSGAPAP